ncbi:hypothetical protein E4K67_22260 [Desulfosporosinus fructosivorans]|uniref:Uncharacterized protein n=1 Tax=Desulfosporosinus fructosivorans TaxID=2018669 RepID=A0A4Z0R1I2_9FIRM|nr:hypothetical protein [Desulfosporosinus fructosivorans]TGE35847.1 hypothetical protein E4K67_22260 [Desulfosporosinus fructosivorans]
MGLKGGFDWVYSQGYGQVIMGIAVITILGMAAETVVVLSGYPDAINTVKRAVKSIQLLASIGLLIKVLIALNDLAKGNYLN